MGLFGFGSKPTPRKRTSRTRKTTVIDKSGFKTTHSKAAAKSIGRGARAAGYSTFYSGGTLLIGEKRKRISSSRRRRR